MANLKKNVKRPRRRPCAEDENGHGENGEKVRSVTLRFVESRVAWLKELMLSMMDKQAEALELQATEYTRRLNQLDQTHAANRDRDNEFVGIEKFDNFIKEFDQFKSTANDKAAVLKDLVDSKATSISDEFRQYRETSAREVALAAGKETQLKETRDDARDTKGWLIPVIIIGGLSVVNLIVQAMQLLRMH